MMKFTQLAGDLSESPVAVRVFTGCCLDPASGRLQEEAEDIPANKKLGELRATDKRESLSVSETDDPSKDHVYGCGKHRGRQKQEQ
jgi:hypothetical protein